MSDERKPVAWLCTDKRYHYLKDHVTDRRVTFEAWRDGGIAFVELVPETEVADLRAQLASARKVVDAARAYYLCAVQDEADDLECCCTENQHELAKALRDALTDEQREHDPGMNPVDDAEFGMKP